MVARRYAPKATAAVVALVAALSLGGPARAELPFRSLYVGPYAGINLTTGDWDLRNADTTPMEPQSSGLVGVHIGGQQTWWFAAEADLGLLPVASEARRTNWTIHYGLDALFHFREGDLVPFGVLGVGAFSNLDGDLGRDTDYELHWGLGLRFAPQEWHAARFEVRHVLTDDRNDDLPIATNVELRLGVDLFPVREVPDADGDTVPDELDRCPAVPGPPAAQGCPDRDGDGIADTTDRCPDQGGAPEHGGCPDADGDGVVDPDDRCPKLAGAAVTGGCPDKDQDGVLDAEDRCPDHAGLQPLAGCPDGDRDGLADPDDRCPAASGPKKYKGCPDSDGDTIPDPDDRCPKVQGLPQEGGCLPAEVAEQFSGSIKGIFFALGSAQVLAKSYPVLNRAVEVMQRYPTLKVLVEGHTDNTGAPELNAKLSQQRADAVRQYLLGKGIATERVSAKGVGSERPVAPNDSEEGRAQNRRIEFHITTQ